jgi:hypothetical protein
VNVQIPYRIETLPVSEKSRPSSYAHAARVANENEPGSVQRPVEGLPEKTRISAWLEACRSQPQSV